METCRSVEQRSLDPFVINVTENLNNLREFLSEWKLPDDLALDAETVNCLASVVRLQSEWVKHRSTTLYADPFLLEEKLRTIPKELLVRIFLHVWHPAVELEQISLPSIAEAMKYWQSLLPFDERWQQTSLEEVRAGSATREELLRDRILRDEAFSEELENFWQTLKKTVAEKGQEGKIRYWDFVGAETYEETVYRAFMTSFLVTYGYATLEVRPLEEEIFIKPNGKPAPLTGKKQLVSIPIAVSVEDWAKWKRGELG
jgi:hypothetical protein